MTDRRLRVAMLTLALVGILVAGYLTYVHYADIKPLCAGGSGGCERVQNSAWAKLAGVPVALLGLITYLTITGATLARGETAPLAATGSRWREPATRSTSRTSKSPRSRRSASGAWSAPC